MRAGEKRQISLWRKLRPQIKAILVAALILPVWVVAALSETLVLPNFWDIRARLERPDLTGGRVVRILTDDEFPPLHFAGPDARPTGFSVELALKACERLNLTCTIQARRFDTLLTSLEEGRGDMIAAALPITEDLRRRFAVTSPYYRFAGRFAAQKATNLVPSPSGLRERTVAVVEGTAHEAYLKAFFAKARIQPHPDLTAAQNALMLGQADFLFSDGLALALWSEGRASQDCCTLLQGAYLDSQYFGEGVGFVLRKEDESLRRALDYALQRLAEEGAYIEAFLKFFPQNPY